MQSQPIAQGLACGIPTVVSCWGGGADFVNGGGAIGVPVELTENGPRVDFQKADAALRVLSRPKENRIWAGKAKRFAKHRLSESQNALLWKAQLKKSRKLSSRRVPLRVSKPFMKAYLGNMNARGWSHDFTFSSARDPLYLKISGIYSGTRPRSRAGKSYSIHPLFFPAAPKGVLIDPVAPVREVPLTRREAAEILLIFREGLTSSVPRSILRRYPWFTKLVRAGILLRSQSFTSKRSSRFP